MTNPLPRRAFPLALLAFALASVGCVPNVAWLPDSSGFVYTGGRGGKQLMAFDLAGKKARVLVADDVGPGWPALSADGKRIALAQHCVRGRVLSLTVHVFDRDGKRLHRSKELPWGKRLKSGGRQFPSVAQVAWSPRGDRLLLGDDAQTGIYDLKTHELLEVEGLIWAFGSSPVRPDGKGAVVVGRGGAYWLEWDGKASPLLDGKKKDRVTFDESGRRLGMLFVALCNSRWEGPVARLSLPGLEVRLDTKKMRAEELAGEEVGPKAPTVRQARSFAGGVGVRLVEEVGADGGQFDFSRAGRLEVLRPGKPPEVIVKAAHYVKFFPSPDGKLLAVRWYPTTRGPPPGKNDRILVLNARGETVADLKASE